MFYTKDFDKFAEGLTTLSHIKAV
ncbi:MAG: hypothetical protein ACLU4J_21745 [Butyricimonas paravirosa]